MKQTGELGVLGDYSFDEKTINMHPNDGYDLGLMTSSHVVRIFPGSSMEEFITGSAKSTFGTLYLNNDCKLGTVELSLRTVERLGKPKRVRLAYAEDDSKYGKLLIEPV